MNEVTNEDLKTDELENRKRPMRRRRLLQRRMYRCGDGEFFWYFAKWDRHGNVVEKVYKPPE